VDSSLKDARLNRERPGGMFEMPPIHDLAHTSETLEGLAKLQSAWRSTDENGGLEK